MREPWVRQYFGSEANARPGFEDELADDLAAAWRGASAGHGAPAASSDDLWAVTRPDAPLEQVAATPHRPADEEPAPLQRRPVSARPAPTGGRRGLRVGLAVAAVAAVVIAVVVRQQSDDSTTPGTPGVTSPSGGTLPGGATVPGQTVDPNTDTAASGGTDTTVDESGSAQGTQYMNPACFETRPTTAIPAAIDSAVLEGSAATEGEPAFRIQLPTPQEGATFAGDTDVRVVPGGVLVKASLTLADGTTSDTMLSVVNNDGVVRWTRCFSNAYTIGPFGENGDGSITIWVARNTTSLARYVDLATGNTSDLFSGYTAATTTDGAPTGLVWSVENNTVVIRLPEAAAVGPHTLSLP